MSRSFMRYTSFLCSLFILASVGGVFATWCYAQYPVEAANENLHITLSQFVWAPEEILPTESTIGENHLALIGLMLNESEKGYGLNYDSKHVLESYLNGKGIIFSNQKTTGGNLKFVSDETEQLYYCIQKISDTLYYAYTFTYSDLNSAKGTNTAIPAYRTLLEKTSTWSATKSYFGYAKTKALAAMGESAVSGALVYSIDVSTWTLG
ncbi:MAG: hypothetical protein IKD06_01255 [Clostridia bacterium]|nr:hypothetical protein [Clostridia bacterium]